MITAAPDIAVLMVCLGNICRSPTAHGVLEKVIENQGLQKVIHVDSAGTGNWHIGQAPDMRAQQAASRRGYDLSQQRARQVAQADFERFDYILAMDDDNLQNLQRLCPTGLQDKIRLLLEFGGSSYQAVPDPYFGTDDDGFELVLDLVESSCQAFFRHVVATHGLASA